MTRVTQNMRDHILSDAIKAAFKDRKAALAAEESALALDAYNAIFDAKTRALVAKLPAGWFSEDACLRVTFGFKQTTVHVATPVRVPANSGYCRKLGTVHDAELIARFDKLADKQSDLKTSEREAEIALRAMLNGFHTLKKLREGWPEGAPFYAAYEAEGAPQVPAVRISEVNALLGLPLAAE